MIIYSGALHYRQNGAPVHLADDGRGREVQQNETGDDLKPAANHNCCAAAHECPDTNDKQSQCPDPKNDSVDLCCGEGGDPDVGADDGPCQEEQANGPARRASGLDDLWHEEQLECGDAQPKPGEHRKAHSDEGLSSPESEDSGDQLGEKPGG